MDASGSGEPARSRVVPLSLVIGSALVAVLAVSALVYVLYSRTEGPGEALRTFAERVADGDCEGAFDLQPLIRVVGPAECPELLEVVGGMLQPDFTVERVVLEDGVAEVDVSGPGTEAGTWSLCRLEEPDEDWAIVGYPGSRRVTDPLVAVDGVAYSCRSA